MWKRIMTIATGHAISIPGQISPDNTTWPLTTMSNSNAITELALPRRIITGHNSEGKAVVIDSEPVPAQTHGDVRFMSVWSNEGVPTKDNADNVDARTRTLPGMGLYLPGGAHHAFTDLAPGATTPFHRSSTIDYNILLSGQVVLILDDDVRTELHPNDTVVQRGTRHAWHNPSKTEWARWVTVLIHAEPILKDGKPLEDLWEA